MKHNLDESQWVRSSHSNADVGNCLEWQRPAPNLVAIRDSKNPQVGPFIFPADAWTAFVNSVRLGEFDQ